MVWWPGCEGGWRTGWAYCCCVSTWQQQWRLRAVSGYQDTGLRQSHPHHHHAQSWLALPPSQQLRTRGNNHPGPIKQLSSREIQSGWYYLHPCGEIGLVWSVSHIVVMSSLILPCQLHLVCLAMSSQENIEILTGPLSLPPTFWLILHILYSTWKCCLEFCPTLKSTYCTKYILHVQFNRREKFIQTFSFILFSLSVVVG